MAGIPLGGIVSIPNRVDLRVNSAGKGKYLNFKVFFSDVDYNGEKFFHCYRMSMWVPEDEANKYEDMLKPGRYFRFSGHLEARVKENQENDPFMSIKVDRQYLMPLKIGSIQAT